MANPSTAWHDAEKHVFDRFCTDTKSKEGANAFRTDELPANIHECWRLDTGGGNAQSTQSGCFGSLIFGGSIEGRFKTRERAQNFACLIMGTLNDTNNFDHVQNIQWFRLDGAGFPVATKDEFTPARSGSRSLPCYIVRMGVQMVFNLSTEYEA